jgi:hypothetical protein
LKEEFDYLPKIAFSIDAFGHSSIMPYLLNALNYEGIVISRVPYEIE